MCLYLSLYIKNDFECKCNSGKKCVDYKWKEGEKEALIKKQQDKRRQQRITKEDKIKKIGKRKSTSSNPIPKKSKK